MQVVFDDGNLEDIETANAGTTKLPVAVIKSARKKLRVLRDAPNELTLRNWKSLHYEKLKGDKHGFKSIRLNKQYRMVLSVENDQSGNPVATIFTIEDYH